MTLSMAPGRLWLQPIDPTVNDDSSQGYEIGNWWLNTSTSTLFQCLDVAVGTAVWDLKPSQQSGSFTPTLEFGGASTGITYSSQQGNWVRNENSVQFNLFVALTNKGTSTGNARLVSLPFANGSIPAAFTFYQLNVGLPANYTSYGARVASSSNEIILFGQAPDVGLQNLTDAEFANNSQVFISGTFFI